MAFSDGSPNPKFETLTSAYLSDETELAKELARAARLTDADRDTVHQHARDMAVKLRESVRRPSVIDAFLQEYSLSSEEGILLMRLAESLIRTPDTATATRLL